MYFVISLSCFSLFPFQFTNDVFLSHPCHSTFDLYPPLPFPFKTPKLQNSIKIYTSNVEQQSKMIRACRVFQSRNVRRFFNLFFVECVFHFAFRVLLSRHHHHHHRQCRNIVSSNQRISQRIKNVNMT